MGLVKYNGKNVFGVGLKGSIARLMPGINEVADNLLNEMKAHPLFQARTAKGIIEILQDSIGKDGKRTVEDMLQHIPNIFDIKLLKKLIDTDGRSPVVKAAQLQLVTLSRTLRRYRQKRKMTIISSDTVIAAMFIYAPQFYTTDPTILASYVALYDLVLCQVNFAFLSCCGTECIRFFDGSLSHARAKSQFRGFARHSRGRLIFRV